VGGREGRRINRALEDEEVVGATLEEGEEEVKSSSSRLRLGGVEAGDEVSEEDVDRPSSNS
jgi:hypothetical protein